jgi:hypothetical protein
MTPEQRDEAVKLHAAGHSALSISRCLGNVSYHTIEAEFDFPVYPDRYTEAFRHWLHHECEYTWRPDNPNPKPAPWSKALNYREYH